jgi:hypothetical protein
MKSDGTLKAAINTGLISTSVIGRCDIYEYFLKIKSSYSDKRTAITIVSEDRKVCEATVYNIIKDFGC